MKIIATTRALNEAANIDRFCKCYAWADRVLVADGGSKDDTIARAERYPNVSTEKFEDRVWRNERWRNPHGKHINFIIDWATTEGADWIIFDDADCVPTIKLQDNFRGILATAIKPAVMLYRLYIWGEDRYFSKMNKPGQSLYAWNLRGINIRAWEGDPFKHRILGWKESDVMRLVQPHSCLHYFFPDEATVKRKKEFREGLGIHKFEPHPLQSFGQLQPLPEWARWKR